MRRWQLTIMPDARGGLPVFLQVSKAVTDDIRSGRLVPGDALPGTRALATQLGVHRNTVIAAYQELAAEGLVQARWGGGTFVAESRPASLRATAAAVSGPSYDVAPPLARPPSARVPPGMLMMFRGIPDVRLLPVAMLTRAYRRAVSGRGRALMSYSDPQGHVRIRSELASMLSRTRGVPATAETVMVTRGSQQALDLVARTLLSPGDVVAVERLGDPSVRNVLRLAGAELVPLALDDQGLDVDALAALLARRRVRAIYVTPHHQFPTNVVMSAARRARLGRLAVEHGVAIIEDDYDHEFHYEGKPVLPLAGGADRGNVVYVGSLSKVFAPGLRTGFIVAPPSVLDRLVSVRIACDLQGDAALECAIADLLEDGELTRHVRRMRKIYARRRDALAAALERHLGTALQFQIPDGGMALWARVDDDIDIARWERAGERQGVLFCGAQVYDFHDRAEPCLRLGFSYHDEAELADAARRMARALKQVR
jgi:GntR family transcriptional regulator/MocR family aminotransferase